MHPAGSAHSWLNRTTIGVSLASLFSDVSHELATAALPAVLLGFGSGPAALGIIEGAADGISAAAKLAGGMATDRTRRRKPLASAGYLVTAVGVAAIGFCVAWWQVLVCRVVAWTGRGSRSAPRDVIMAEAARSEDLAKAYGLERAGDSAGAVLGPLLAMALLAGGLQPASVVRHSLLPGLLAFLSIALFVREVPSPAPLVRRSVLDNLAAIDRPYRRFLAGVFVFGCGDFSRTLLILYATQHLRGSLLAMPVATLAVGLYVLHNAVAALAAFPLGAIADRWGRKKVLIGGYMIAAAVTAAFAFLSPTPATLAALFVGSGLCFAVEEVAEKATAVGLLGASVRGTGLGVLAAVNGVADIVASVLVGGLWAALPSRPGVGFLAASALQLAGTVVIARALFRR